jgi:hypothetical protein
MLLTFAFSPGFAQAFRVKDYLQIRDGNEWRYTAPPGWKDGDYVSRIAEDKTAGFFRHFDATKAAKLLSVKKDGTYHIGEEFPNPESSLKFDTPILQFPSKLKIGQKLEDSREFTRVYKSGKTVRGKYKISQTFAGFEDIKATAGGFKKCLRVESETFWDLGDGTKARTVNVYHYAKGVGVVKASARFIIINAEGKETINRLVETDLKSYKINK